MSDPEREKSGREIGSICIYVREREREKIDRERER